MKHIDVIIVAKNRYTKSWYAKHPSNNTFFGKDNNWTSDPSANHNRKSRRELISDIKTKYKLYLKKNNSSYELFKLIVKK